MKRFTETEKWRDSWFRKLPPTLKLGYAYLLDAVDICGVWDPDPELANWLIGEEIDWDELRSFAGDRIVVLGSGKWWVRKFVGFQYGELSDACRPHQAVLRLLKQHGIEGYLYPSNTHQDKDKDKDQDKDKDKDSTPRVEKRPRVRKAGTLFIAEMERVMQERLVDLCMLLGQRKEGVWQGQAKKTWNAKEIESVKAARLLEIGAEEWEGGVWALWRYYRQAGGDNDYRRTGTEALVNNWADDVVKASRRMEPVDTVQGNVEQRDGYARQEWHEARKALVGRLGLENSMGNWLDGVGSECQ